MSVSHACAIPLASAAAGCCDYTHALTPLSSDNNINNTNHRAETLPLCSRWWCPPRPRPHPRLPTPTTSCSSLPYHLALVAAYHWSHHHHPLLAAMQMRQRQTQPAAALAAVSRGRFSLGLVRMLGRWLQTSQRGDMWPATWTSELFVCFCVGGDERGTGSVWQGGRRGTRVQHFCFLMASMQCSVLKL